MYRKDFYLLGILWLCTLFIFLPIFYKDYIFMDEAREIWGYNSIPGYYLFVEEGRWLAGVMHRWLFSSIQTIHQVIWLRLLSLFGWLLCLPVWYAIIKREVANVKRYDYLPFFTCLYLITSLPFIVSVQWATCLQFFIGDTASILVGAIVLDSIRSGDKKLRMVFRAIILPLLLGVPALFLYQPSWACFLIPFLLYFINPMNFKKDRVLVGGMLVHLLVYAAYYLTYKASFHFFFNDIVPDPRNELYISPLQKIAFFLARPLERSFRFTLLTNEDSPISKLTYAGMLLSFIVLSFVRFGKDKWLKAIEYMAVIGCIWVVSYLPGLLVKENYASNRTLMALNMCVFIVCLEMVLYFIKNKRVLQVAGLSLAMFFVLCANYNFRQAFLRPQVEETAALKNYIGRHFNKDIHTVYFIRPAENFVAEKYHVNQSMDEIGVASSFFTWVPDALVKQLIYEATGNREQALGVVVKQWAGKEEYIRSGQKTDSSTLLVDVPAIINTAAP
jgi:hypothetical protein